MPYPDRSPQLLASRLTDDLSDLEYSLLGSPPAAHPAGSPLRSELDAVRRRIEALTARLDHLPAAPDLAARVPQVGSGAPVEFPDDHARLSAAARRGRRCAPPGSTPSSTGSRER